MLAGRNGVGKFILGGGQVRQEIIIDGKNFDDMEGFYCEIEKLLTKDLGWKIGRNLDAFNDVLRGGFGVHEYGEPIKIIWKNFKKSKKDFGYEAIIRQYEYILAHPHPFTDIDYVQSKLLDAKNGVGETLMDVLVEIITSNDPGHKNCMLEILD